MAVVGSASKGAPPPAERAPPHSLGRPARRDVVQGVLEGAAELLRLDLDHLVGLHRAIVVSPAGLDLAAVGGRSHGRARLRTRAYLSAPRPQVRLGRAGGQSGGRQEGGRATAGDRRAIGQSGEQVGGSIPWGSDLTRTEDTKWADLPLDACLLTHTPRSLLDLETNDLRLRARHKR